MTIRKIASIACVAFGSVNILNFWAPVPIPTVGVSAFIVGALFIGLGVYIGAPRAGSGASIWKRLLGSPGAGNDPSETKQDIALARDPLLAVRALRLAADSKGILTVAQTAMRLDVPLDAAQAALDECVVKGTAYIDVDGASGVSGYYFPEFLPKD